MIANLSQHCKEEKMKQEKERTDSEKEKRTDELSMSGGAEIFLLTEGIPSKTPQLPASLIVAMAAEG
ncbi:uncharacterized [Tachysurus ichikawai]